MKKHLLICLQSLLVSGGSGLHAQQLDADREIVPRLQTLPSGEKILSWMGQENHTYFFQATHDFKEWTWAPNIETGIAASMSYEVDGPSDKGFFRIVRTDQTAADPDQADFDQDQLTNLQEITPRPRPGGSGGNSTLSPTIQTNPLDPDTDHDGLGDRWEEDHGLDPTDDGRHLAGNGLDGDSDHDGLTNDAERALGTNPLNADSDGDELPDEWELRYGLNPSSPDEAAGLADQDGHLDDDSAHNLLEFLGGTNPLDSLEYPPTLSTLSRTSLQSFTVPADSEDDPSGSISAFPFSGWNNPPTGFFQEITASIPSAFIAPFLASNVTFPTEIPYYSFDFLVRPMKLEPPSRFNYYGKHPTHDGGTHLTTELNQSRCWMEISPKQISTTAQKISVLHVSRYWSTSSSFVPPEVFPPDLSDPLWTPFAAKVVQFEFPPGESVSCPLDMDQQLIGDGENISVTSSSFLETITVKWRAVEGSANVSDHTDPWTTQVNGMRIFPCHKNPADTEIRNKLEVIVQAPISLRGQPVFVKAFDVDDTTSEVFDRAGDGTTNPIIDVHGKAGGDNLPDYLGTPQAGQFWTGSAWGGATAQGIVDENGEAKFIFRVGMQPGNNYRVVASVIDQKMFEGVQVTDPSASGFLGTDFLQSGGAPATSLLTVWRRLWVENDSMKAIGTHNDGNLKNDLTSDVSNPTVKNTVVGNGQTIVQFNPVISDQSSLRNLENGRLILSPSGVHQPISSFANYGPLGDGVVLSGEHSGIMAAQPFRIYDDDDFGLNRPPLPRTDLIDNTFKNVYKPAFIEVVDTANFMGRDYNPNKTVDFYRNHPVMIGPWGFQSPGVWDDAIDLTDSKPLWVGNLIAGYQGEVVDDGDPGSEGHMEGITPGSRRYSIVYVENVRDYNDPLLRNLSTDNAAMNSEIVRNIKLTAAHEIGHMPGGGDETSHHAEKMLMGEDGYGGEDGLEFSAKSILRFRKTNQWQQP